jgi:serine beta-lactamase-like protein LACTB
MKRSILLGLTILAACHTAIPPTPPAQTGIVDPHFRGAISESRAALDKRAHSVPGMTIAVSIGDRIVWSEGIGWSDIERHHPMQPDAQMRIYSVTKPLTATLALKLEEEKRIDLNRSIGEILPDLPPHLRSITTTQLLSQMSGIRDYRRGEWLKFASLKCATPADALRQFENDALESPAGTKWNYSTFNYVLASAVLEKAGGAPFHTLLRDNILDPASMRRSVPDSPDFRDVTFYEPSHFGRVAVSTPVDNRCKFGAGGLLSSASDLVAFGSALIAGRLIPDADAKRLFTPQNHERDYGLGFGLSNDDQLGPIAAHSGSAFGGTSYLLVVPRERLVVAILVNEETDKLRDEAFAVARAFAKSQQK